MKYEDLLKLSIVGVAGLTGCVTQQKTEQQQMSNITSQKEGIVTEAFTMNSCDNSEKFYYFEIDTDASKKGPEFAAVTYFACGSRQMQEAQERYPAGAAIDMTTLSPYISKLLKLEGNTSTVICRKTSVPSIKKSMENQH